MKIMIIGDTHFPYVNKQALKKLYKAIKEEKPTHVVQIGDLYDQYNFSRFSKKNIDTSVSEVQTARRDAETFWSKVRSLTKAACYQILGNHDIRALKRVGEKVPEAYELFKEKIDELYTFKGVKTLYDEREELVLGKVVFTHGWLSQLGAHMRYFGRSVVCGHSHVGGSVFSKQRGTILFELNAGYLADENAEPLKYRPTKTCKWTLGYGIINFKQGIACPSFVPLK